MECSFADFILNVFRHYNSKEKSLQGSNELLVTLFLRVKMSFLIMKVDGMYLCLRRHGNKHEKMSGNSKESTW